MYSGMPGGFEGRLVNAIVSHIEARMSAITENIVCNRHTDKDGMARALETEFQRGALAELSAFLEDLRGDIMKKINEEG